MFYIWYFLPKNDLATSSLKEHYAKCHLIKNVLYLIFSPQIAFMEGWIEMQGFQTYCFQVVILSRNDFKQEKENQN